MESEAYRTTDARDTKLSPLPRHHHGTTTATVDSGNLGGRRMIAVEPATATTNTGTPERPFRFDDINNVMSGIVTTIVPHKTNAGTKETENKDHSSNLEQQYPTNHDDDGDDEEEVASKTSLWTDSSIPSVVQLLFTKSVDTSQPQDRKQHPLHPHHRLLFLLQ